MGLAWSDQKPHGDISVAELDNETREQFLYLKDGLKQFSSFDETDSALNRLTLIGKIMTLDPAGQTTLQAVDSANVVLTFNSGSGTLQLTNTGVVVGAATGGDQGVGTLNATAVYDDGVGPLTDYVLESALIDDGPIDLQRFPSDPARRFDGNRDELDPEVYAKKWKARGALPSMPTYDQRKAELYPTGLLVQGLYEAVEVMAVHIDKLNRRIVDLEKEIQNGPKW